MTRYRKVELYFEKILRILTKGFLSNLASTTTSSTFVFEKEVHLSSQVVCSNWNGTLLCRYKGICSGGWRCPNFCKSVRHLLHLQCANKLLDLVSAEMLHWRIPDQLKPAVVEVVRFLKSCSLNTSKCLALFWKPAIIFFLLFATYKQTIFEYQEMLFVHDFLFSLNCKQIREILQ